MVFAIINLFIFLCSLTYQSNLLHVHAYQVINIKIILLRATIWTPLIAHDIFLSILLISKRQQNPKGSKLLLKWKARWLSYCENMAKRSMSMRLLQGRTGQTCFSVHLIHPKDDNRRNKSHQMIASSCLLTHRNLKFHQKSLLLLVAIYVINYKLWKLSMQTHLSLLS